MREAHLAGKWPAGRRTIMIEARGADENLDDCEIVGMRGLGRLLQLAGLVAPPLSMLLQLSQVITLGQMLAMLLGSVCLFGIGRIVEGYGR